jgi:hypothetical protein
MKKSERKEGKYGIMDHAVQLHGITTYPIYPFTGTPKWTVGRFVYFVYFLLLFFGSSLGSNDSFFQWNVHLREWIIRPPTRSTQTQKSPRCKNNYRRTKEGG